jgi:hypothetical protein
MSNNITYMRKTVPVFIPLLLLISLSSGFAEEIFAPFVSGLTAKTEDNKIILSWRAAPAEINSYVIYRSDVPIEESTFSRSVEVATVPGSQLSYIDTPHDTKGYFYAVLGKSADGTLYKLFIPYRNVILRAQTVETILAPEHAATVIRDISAEIEGEKVKITFKSSKENRQVLLFRSGSPIMSESDLLSASALATIEGKQGMYVDYPLGGIPYYYAAFDAEMAKAGSYPIEPGENVLVQAVSVPVAEVPVKKRIHESRLSPLPYLLISSAVFSGEDLEQSYTSLPSPSDLEEDTLEVWKRLKRKLEPVQKTVPVLPILLPSEQIEGLQGEQGRLTEIVRDAFGSGDPKNTDWNTVALELRQFLGVRHSDKVKDRAEFYLGQALFFLGDYRGSLMKFLLSGDSLSTESREWIERIYPHLIALYTNF